MLGSLVIMDEDVTYEIVCFAFKQPKKIIKSGLTLEEAKEFCDDPETSSQTCTGKEGLARTERLGDWFFGFRKE